MFSLKNKNSKIFSDDKVKTEKPIHSIIVYMVVIILIYLVINLCIFNAVIPSASMEDTISVGDRVIGFRLAYTFDDVERGDIVIFNSPEGDGKYFIKRVIGLPGETIDINDGYVYVNGSILEETYLQSECRTENYNLEVPYTVPEGKYFLLGDNRSNSQDSRFWEEPCISSSDIVAKAVLRYYPLDRIGTLS